MVLTLPTAEEFGDVAQRAVGELARRRGFGTRQWSDLETAVSHTHTLLRRGRGDRIRFTFEARDSAIVVEAQLTGTPGRARPVRGDAIRGDAVVDFHEHVDALVEDPQVDPDAGRVRFSKSRH